MQYTVHHQCLWGFNCRKAYYGSRRSFLTRQARSTLFSLREIKDTFFYTDETCLQHRKCDGMLAQMFETL